MSTPPKVLDLVEVFERNADDYQSARFNEAMLRQQFVNPLFKCLGWDMDNEQGYAEAYKDVIHEAAIKIGGATKAPDYSFRIGGTPKFYLEAKKPSVNVKDDPAPAFQLRRYAWSARMPLSILTNFAEFAVYDCRVKPAQTDKASTARILYLRCAEFAGAWDDKIAGVFAREAVLKGSFDKFADSKKGKRGTAAVDAAFLDEIETWRDELAKNLALRNPELTSRELNFAVQITIDRIIFLRMCEDRGVEPYGQLQKLQGQADVYEGLRALYRKADERYNSGLFHFHKEKDRAESPDELTPRLTIDDKVLKSIFRGLYYPESPYEFSVLPVEILGQVYEQFLGKVIRLTAAHQAKVEEKPEVKKAGGVYYTPSYIVDYIVEHTVGRLLEGKTPKEAAGLTVLDPACGSGSFLLGAYRRLLEWHLKQYEDDGPQKHKKQVFQGAGGAWRLTTAEKKRILLNNVYGVDIDPQAVEVTKLSLLLKVLEGESQETIDTQLKLFHERALPDLSGNIKCGNSLIGPDFYEGRQAALFDEEERYRINVFDWDEKFPKIMKAGGFDAVIGNPPYVNAWELFAAMPAVREYINDRAHYVTADRHWDLYVVFIEQSLNLLRAGGRLSFIIPFSYCIQKYAMQSRNHILDLYRISSVADLRTVRVFGRVPVITIIPVIEKSKPTADAHIKIMKPGPASTTYQCVGIVASHEIGQSAMLQQHEAMLRLDLSPEVTALIGKINDKSLKLDELCYINYGAQMSSKIKGKFGKDHVIRDRCESANCRRMISGRDLYRYSAAWAGKYVDWSHADQMYGPRWPGFFETPKLMIRDITGTHRIEATLDDTALYCDHTVLCALRKCDIAGEKTFDGAAIERSRLYDLRFLAGLIASKLVSAYYYFVLTGEGVRTGGGFHTYPHTIRQFPIIRINFSAKSDMQGHDRLIQLVEHMLALHKGLAAAKAPHDKTVLQGQIDATDRQIDRLVYDLYGLTEEEIRIVEQSGG